MVKENHFRLTDALVRLLEVPNGGEVTYWDTEVPGFGVRCIPSGAKAYIVTYRAGYGRSGIARRMTIGKVGAYRLKDARDAALDIRARVLRGGDPVKERREAALMAKTPDLALAEALDRYEANQKRRGVVARERVMGCLRNHLLGFTGGVPLKRISRRTVVEAIERLEQQGKHGAASDLRSRTSTFMKWCCDQGFVSENPLHGYRAPRATRAQRLSRTGRELSAMEIGIVYSACGAAEVNPAYGTLVRTLILTGQRRTETSRMRWSDISSESMTWRIPCAEAKNGIDHDVPIPQMLHDEILSLSKRSECEFVFSTNGIVPISGWSKLDRKLRKAANAMAASKKGGGFEIPHWTLHDLRRTFRSGLTRLGIENDIAEIMLNHRPKTLKSIYDLDPRMAARREAADRWAAHVAGILDPAKSSTVVSIAQ